jgi:hypothetical protein
MQPGNTQVDQSTRPFARRDASDDASRNRDVRCVGAAFALASVAPALMMALYWRDHRLSPLVFAFTLTVEFGHTIFLALPLFLVFQSSGWVNLLACVIMGSVIGAAPVSILTFRISPSTFYALVRANGGAAALAALWVSCIKPLIYFGLFGALGGLLFWATLTCSRWFDRVR